MYQEPPGNDLFTDRSARIKEFAAEAGFSFCGIADARIGIMEQDYESSPDYQVPELDYLRKNKDILDDPLKLMPGAKSVIALLYNYYPQKKIPEKDNFILAKYAYGKDHHVILKKKMHLLISRMNDAFGDTNSLVFVDSGRMREKSWAQRSGVGWQGKNSLVINPRQGSFFFIGLILTNLELLPDPPETDHCGQCHLCMDACPTQAIIHPYVLDPRRCISFHTIETKDPVPEEIAGLLHDRIYGCDICQDACPYNKRALPTVEPDFAPSEELFSINKKSWLEMDEEKFERLFKGSAIKRTGYQKLSQTIKQIYNL